MRKVLDAAACLALLLSAGLAGGSLYGYLWITNTENQENLKKGIIDSVMKNVPIPGGITGPALPTKAPGKTTGKMKLPSF